MLKPEDIEKLRGLLIEACDNFIAKGGTVIAGSFRNDYTHYCPVTCLVGMPETGGFDKPLSKILGTTLSANELWQFTDAFDGYADGDQSPLSRLGRELRTKYLGK